MGAKQTLLQFPMGAAGINAAAASSSPQATVCNTCQQRFSSGSRFCPFDGEALTAASDWDRAPDPLIGAVIERRYRVERVLGAGGMGTVYEARHTALGKRFALKVLRAELGSDAQVTARFVQEARAAASVRHPGLVEITDFGQLPSGQAYFAMEYLEGQSLSQVLRQEGPLPARRAIEITRQAAEALNVAHQRGIVHRDLKPDNIQLDPSAGFGERVKIVDFGLAHVAGSSRLTRAGIVYGTPHYMSPEQAAGELSDPRSDIYSLGVVLYEMVTGRVPFEADTYLGVLSLHMYAAPEHPRKFSRDFSGFGALEAIILRCLEKNPADRYASLPALLEDLGRAEQPAEASAVRTRSSIAPGSAQLAGPNGLAVPFAVEPADGPASSARLWLKLAVVAAAFAASISFAFAFRPKHEAAPESPSNRASVALPVVASPASPALDGLTPHVAPGATEASAPAPSAPSALSPAVPSVHASRRVSAGAAQKPSGGRGSAKLPGASEIVDPWARH